jgi:hypothetical protein
MRLVSIFADAYQLWRRDRDLWLRVAGFFFFMPALALYWFAPLPALKDVETEAAQKLVAAWFEANAIGLLGFILLITFGYGVVLTLLLDDRKPVLANAITRALRLLPGLTLASFLTGMLVGLGLIAFVVPGLYVAGRVLLTLPVLVAEPERGPFGALIVSVQRSHARGWMLMAVTVSGFLAVQFAAGLIGGIADAAGASSGPVEFACDVLFAAVAAAGALAQALLQAAAYRVLTGARQGI